MKILYPLSILGLAAVVSSCATNPAFRRLDANSNSKVSEKEFVDHVQSTAFAGLDTDDSGYVTNGEWLAYETTDLPRARFNRLDRNGDRKLSLKEFSEVRRKHLTLKNLFGTLDNDGDGFLTPSELETER